MQNELIYFTYGPHGAPSANKGSVLDLEDSYSVMMIHNL
jgi:hypothetical protein